MREPQAAPSAPKLLMTDRQRLALLLVLVPVLMAAGAWLGSRLSGPMSLMHPAVSLAERFVREQNNPPKTGVLTPDELALERARIEPKEILGAAAEIRHRFEMGGWIFGAWVGLVIGAKLVSLSLHRRRTDYEPDRGDCFACARCFEFCPNELVRRGLTPPVIPATPPQVAAKEVTLAS
jgi:hypothetical protein